jgi:hypothetical protein
MSSEMCCRFPNRRKRGCHKQCKQAGAGVCGLGVGQTVHLRGLVQELHGSGQDQRQGGGAAVTVRGCRLARPSAIQHATNHSHQCACLKRAAIGLPQKLTHECVTVCCPWPAQQPPSNHAPGCAQTTESVVCLRRFPQSGKTADTYKKQINNRVNKLRGQMQLTAPRGSNGSQGGVHLQNSINAQWLKCHTAQQDAWHAQQSRDCFEVCMQCSIARGALYRWCTCERHVVATS